jgi:hypothetical protein
VLHIIDTGFRGEALENSLLLLESVGFFTEISFFSQQCPIISLINLSIEKQFLNELERLQ